MPSARRTLLACLFPVVLHAQVMPPPRQAPVEVVVPKPPTPVITDGRLVLVYELHVTNFGSRPLALRSVEIFSEGPTSTRPVAILQDSALLAAFQAVGRHAGDSARIDPGARGVLFLWLVLSAADPPPSSLRHRLSFAVVGSGAALPPVVASVIDSLIVPVEREHVMVLAPPLDDGDWLVGDGPSNFSAHRRSLVPLNGKARVSQRFALDLVKIGPNGNTWHDNRSRPENFWGYGEPVHAAAPGEVVAVVDSITDNAPDQPLPPPSIATIAGNYVIMRIGPLTFCLFAHLARGSIRVKPGQRIRRGDVLGRLGNSGQTTGPHLHFQVMDAPSPLAAEGVPFVFDQFGFLGLGRDYEPSRPRVEVVRRREIPIDDAVVHFAARADQ
jgi:hypothetical protein